MINTTKDIIYLLPKIISNGRRNDLAFKEIITKLKIL